MEHFTKEKTMKEQIIALLLASIDFNKLVASVTDGKVTKEELHGAVNFEGLADGLLDNVIEPLLDKIVTGTEYTWDDSAKALLYPMLEKELKKIIDTKIGNADGK
jgi:hypothetical protein